MAAMGKTHQLCVSNFIDCCIKIIHNKEKHKSGGIILGHQKSENSFNLLLIYYNSPKSKDCTTSNR